MRQKGSLQSKIIRLFTIAIIIPILVLSLFSYSNFSQLLKSNTRDLTMQNLRQVDENLQIWMESYEDVLYQIYTNDDVVNWVDKLNQGIDTSVTKNQLRRYVHALLNTKEYIRAITIITENGTLATYDTMAVSTYDSSWLSQFSMTQQELYDDICQDSKRHIYQTEYGSTFANKDYYLFHIGHRIIDYKDLDKRSGIVIISIDEDFLENICMTEQDETHLSSNFIIGKDGTLISYPKKEKIGQAVLEEPSSKDWENSVRRFLLGDNTYNLSGALLSSYIDEKLGWMIVNIADQSAYMHVLNMLLLLICMMSVALFGISLYVTYRMSKQLSSSVKSVVTTMKKAQAGDLTVTVAHDDSMPAEIEVIADQFNDMLKKLNTAQINERRATEEQQKAEIKMLEAQINPHFLYNILDTINWMAIDRDEFDISNAINSLATILRYAIANRNEVVELKTEIEWLKKYIYLQQFRLKNEFECKIDIPKELMNEKVHKLLLQPFVENALIHGFDGKKDKCILEVIASDEGATLLVIIKDNGKGMDTSQVFSESNQDNDRHHIGMKNAILRLQMYYGEAARVDVKSEIGRGTEILLSIPKL